MVEVDAADPANALGLRLEIELLASGLVRTRATLTNLADAPGQGFYRIEINPTGSDVP